ncbi:ester cyclase [Phycicoccus avicenniae]|uniref:ester cyclase n=1 Tax=Phycicoccus avicenniae TaxID=2828860 RepID=UPI003D2CD5A9
MSTTPGPDTPLLRETYARYLRACNERDWDRVREHLAPRVLVNEVARTPEEYVEDLKALVDVFPDYRWRLHRCLVDGDWVAVHLRDHGTRHRPFHGSPGDGSAVSTDEFAMYRFDDAGLIAEVEVTADDLRLTL